VCSSDLTNDCWWGDTPGYKQHLSYARLRAIETGRWVVRSANTGTSALIDPQGKMVHRTDWWQPKAFRATIPALSDTTWFVRLGDDWSAAFGLVGLLMWASLVFGSIGKLAFNKTKRPRGGKNSTP
jgi:apolipoprotein N-acyltransferase